MIKDNTGRSLAFFLNKNTKKILNKNKLDKIKNLSTKNKEDTRICLHDSKNKDNQIMLICKYRNSQDKLRYYKNNYKKLYLIIDGILILNDKKKNIELSKKKNLCLFANKKNNFSTYSKSKTSLYLEIIFKN